MTRHHHGDGDGALPSIDGPGVPFNEYARRMLADVDNVRDLCGVLEANAGELGDTTARELDRKIGAARRFMDALAIMPSMIRTATPAEVAAAGRQAGGPGAPTISAQPFPRGAR